MRRQPNDEVHVAHRMGGQVAGGTRAVRLAAMELERNTAQVTRTRGPRRVSGEGISLSLSLQRERERERIWR